MKKQYIKICDKILKEIKTNIFLRMIKKIFYFDQKQQVHIQENVMEIENKKKIKYWNIYLPPASPEKKITLNLMTSQNKFREMINTLLF